MLFMYKLKDIVFISFLDYTAGHIKLQ
jgi:hypothetical protein